MQVPAKPLRGSPHVDDSANGFLELGNIVKLPVDRQVIEQELHSLTPSSEIVHVLVELVEESLGPKVDAAGTV
jgi:hypothetical protein